MWKAFVISPSLAATFCLSLACCWTSALAAPGDWPELRQNSRLTGIQPMPGKMKVAPTLLAQYDLGRTQPALHVMALPNGSGHVALTAVGGALQCYNTNGERLWECHPLGLNFPKISAIRSTEDLDGDGTVEILAEVGRSAQPFGAAVLVSLTDGAIRWRYDVEPMSYSWRAYTGDYLPGTASKQIVIVMHGYPPDKDNGHTVLFEYPEQGKPPVQRWRYNFDKYTCFPTLLQTDLDGDGVKELVVETHSRMWFLDALTGAVKHFAQWDPSPGNVRSYGLVRFVDLNGDGREDFLCIGDFAQHHEVLLNKDGKMELAWVHGWGESVTTGKVATAYPEPPYADLDGDGQYEIIVSMFNSEGENAWLLRAYNVLTGELKYRMPGLIAVSTGDVNGDERAEVLANASADPTRTKLDGSRLLRLQGGNFTVVWQDDAAVACGPKPRKGRKGRTPKTGSPVPPVPDQAFLIQENGAFYQLVVGDGGAISAEPWTPPSQEPAPDFSKVPALVGPPFPDLLAAELTGDGRNDLILYQESIVKVLELRGGALAENRTYSSAILPAVADLDGDARIELVLAEMGPNVTPRVRAVTPALDDKVLWDSEFPPAGRTGLPQPRTGYIRTGRFAGKPTPDLYVFAGTPLVRSAVLEGTTGKMLWDKGETPGIERYWAPTVNLASTFDFDGDGKEDLVFTNPDYYCVASGITGEPLLGPLFPPQIFNQPSQGLYTLPAILEQPSGEPTVCLVAGHYFQAAMSLHAKPYWYKLPQAGENRCAREGFMRSGAGEWLMGFGRENGSFACVNVLDGALRWELPVEASCSDVATGDADGDGQQEFVFGTSHHKLYAVGDGGSAPRLVWALDTTSAAGSPILADLDADGAIEIIVPTADGYVNVLAAPREPVTAQGGP